MAGALGVVITTDVSVEGRAAVPVYVDDSLPIVGPSRAVQVVTSGPMAGGSAQPVRVAPSGTPAIGPALPVYVVSGSLGASFAPTDITGLMAWYKSNTGTYTTSAGSTPATADSDPVGRWEDQSGNGRHVTQATAGKRPLLKTNISGGYPAIRTDGTDDWMSGSWSAVAQPITIVACCIPRGSLDDADVLIDGFDSTHRQAIFINSGNFAAFYGGSAAVNTTYRYGLNRPHMPYAVFNGASSIHSTAPDLVSATGNVGAQSSNGIWIGSEFAGTNPRFVNVDYLEILVYNSALSQAQLSQIQAYFQSRYGFNRPTPYTASPIIALGAGGSWEDGDVANPDVFRDTPNNRWVMNYSGYDGAVWKTGLAYSTDLLAWTKEAANPVFAPNGSEGNIAANGSIVLKGSTYYLYYQAGVSGGNQICCATSTNLINWTRQNSGNPVIAIDAADLNATADPAARLMSDGTTIEVYYMTNSGGARRIRRATSTDGVTFSKVATGTFLLTGINDQNTFGEPYPIGDYGTNMQLLTDWSIGSAQARRIVLWTTADGGATWTFNGVFYGPNPSLSWESAQDFDGCAIVSGGTMYLFHAGGTANGAAAGLNAQIGVATLTWS